MDLSFLSYTYITLTTVEKIIDTITATTPMYLNTYVMVFFIFVFCSFLCCVFMVFIWKILLP